MLIEQKQKNDIDGLYQGGVNMLFFGGPFSHNILGH